jgi:hypothetical protein
MERTEQIGSVWIVVMVVAVACGLLIIHPARAIADNSTLIGTGPITGLPDQEPGSDVIRIVSPDFSPREVRIGPSHVLYGLKVSFEELDVSFTKVPEERVQKQLSYAQTRIAEVKTELLNNRTAGAETALSRYRETMAATARAVSSLPSDGQGLVSTQELAAEQQAALFTMVRAYQHNAELKNAFSGGLELEKAFSEKTGQTIEKYTLPDNRVALVAIRIVQTPVPDQTPVSPSPVTTPPVKGTVKPVITVPASPSPAPQATPPVQVTIQPGPTRPTPGVTVTIMTTPPVATPVPTPSPTIPPTTEPTKPPVTPTPTPLPTSTPKPAGSEGSNSGGAGTQTTGISGNHGVSK